jgi:hypothetical protein
MVIRFGLVPGAVDRGRCGCNHSGPTKFDPWQPRRDSDPDLSACKSERPTVRLRGSFVKNPIEGRVTCWEQGAALSYVS